MPFLRAADFTDVPVDRTGDGIAVCGGISGVWNHAGDGEMAFFYVLDRNSDGDRSACATPAGRGELAGIRGGAGGFGGRAAGARMCGGFCGKAIATGMARSWRGG